MELKNYEFCLESNTGILLTSHVRATSFMGAVQLVEKRQEQAQIHDMLSYRIISVKEDE